MKKIEFVNNTGKSPLQRTQEVGYRDITFLPHLRNRVAKFNEGSTWVRFLPSIRGSAYDWMLPVEVHQDVGGITFTSPTTFNPNANNPFELARRWFQRNEKGALRSKSNPNGLRLYPKRMGVSWIIIEHAPEGERLKIFNKSLYDGAWGGNTGLAYNIRKEAEARDEEPGSKTLGELIHGDITAIESGRLVKIERKQGKNEYTDYSISIGKNPAPIEYFMSLLTDEETELIEPIEKTLYIPSEEEEMEILRRYIGDIYMKKIFGSTLTFVSNNRTLGFSVKEDEELLPVAKEEPLPKQPVASSPKPTAPAKESPSENKLFSTKEVTSILAKGKEGIEYLLNNKHRLRPDHLEIVLDTAQEMGVEVEEE